MLGGHSRSRSRQNLFSQPQASPSRKRVTRSQSRELEETRIGSKEVNPTDGHGKREQSKALPPVVEESPFKSPRKTVAHYGSSTIPESPGDTTNISGTTFVQLESEMDLDPEMMIEVIPDLERVGKRVLEFLAPRTATPVVIVNKAKTLSDPRNTQSRRLRRLTTDLDNEIKHFGSQTYLDVGDIGHIFASTLGGRRGEFSDWGPDPILQLANCARFAVEILLAGTSTNSQRQAIQNIENLFPLPFMIGLVGTGQEKAPGESSLEKETFELALQIRTQSLILQLEENQGKPGFSAKSAIRMCFFTGLSRKSPLRGFNLPNLGGSDGTLPEQYEDPVRKHLSEILLSETEDGIDVEELRNSYLWKRFALQAAMWIRKRTEEIDEVLQMRMTAQEVHDAFFNSKHPSFASTVGGSETQLNGETQEDELETSQQQSVEQEVTGLPEEEEQQQQQPKSPAVQTDTERRRSSRPSYLNALSIQRITQRREHLRAGVETSENRRQSDIVQPVSRTVNEQPTTSRQRSSSDLALNRPAQQNVPHSIPQSFDDVSPTLGPEEDITFGDDSQLSIGNEDPQIERSRSPAPVPRSTAPWSQESGTRNQSSDERTRIWEATKTGPGRSVATRFIDRQQDAARVSPIRDSESEGAVRRVEERASRKRARRSSESEPEAGPSHFDYDRRSVDLEGRRAEKPQESRRKRARVEEPETQDDANADTNEEEAPSPEAPRQRTVPPSSQPTTREYPPTTRVRWTEEEDNRLLRLIKDHSTRWAVIERQNDAQPPRKGEAKIEGRDQGALKDRARNIKIAYYRDGIEIPPYLQPVTMKRKDYERLEARGIVVPR